MENIPVTDTTETQVEATENDWAAITDEQPTVDSGSQQSAVENAMGTPDSSQANPQPPVNPQSQVQPTAPMPDNQNIQDPAQQPVVEPQQPPAFQVPNFMTKDDQGNEIFNPVAAMEFAEKYKPSGVVDPNTSYQNNLQKFQQQQMMSPQPPPEPEVDPMVKYETETKSALFGGFDKIQEYYNKGYSVEDAFKMAYNDTNTMFRDHMTKWQHDHLNKGLTERQEKFQEQQRVAALQPQATQNLEYLGRKNGWGSGNDLKNFLTNKDAGGGFAHVLFSAMNPDYNKPGQSQEEYVNTINELMTKATSDINILKVWEEYARMKPLIGKLPQLMREANARGQSVNSANSKAPTRPAGKKSLNYKTTGKKSGNATLNFLRGASYDV